MLEVVDGALDAALRGASWGHRGARSGKHGAFRGVKELRTGDGSGREVLIQRLPKRGSVATLKQIHRVLASLLTHNQHAATGNVFKSKHAAFAHRFCPDVDGTHNRRRAVFDGGFRARAVRELDDMLLHDF